MTLDILVFGPHPDDAELGAGGTIAKHAALGYAVGIIDLTQGEMSNNGTPRQRRREAEEAAARLGVKVRQNLGFPDFGVTISEENVLQLVKLLRTYRPRIIIAPAGNDDHPDHQTASLLITRAAFATKLVKLDPGSEPYRPGLILYYQQFAPEIPQVVVDISEYVERKMSALAAHSSQFGSDGDNVQTDLNTNYFLDGVKGRDSYFGSLIGRPYGEGFNLRKPVPFIDFRSWLE